MDSLTAPLEALEEKAAWFTRARELRLLHVAAGAELRELALQQLMAQEFHADNRSPFVRLDDEHLAADGGWATRAERLVAAHEQRREVLAREGLRLSRLPAEARTRTPLDLFALRLLQVVQAHCKPLEGLVVVLAPMRVEVPRAFEAELRELAQAPALRWVRWAVVEAGAVSIPRLLEELGGAALRVECKVDEEAQQQELARMVAGAAAAGHEAPGPMQVGAAWPRGVTLPPRVGKPPLRELSTEQRAVLEQAGVPPALVLGGGQRLRATVLRAAQALREQRGAEALRSQREARDLCLEMGMGREAVIMELVLGAYQTRLDERHEARETYHAAARRAQQAHLPQQEVQALLALGALAMIEREPALALEAYSEAGRVAEQAHLPLLAIEGHRLAGQVAAAAGLEQQAATSWRAALAVGERASPVEVHASSAAEVARALAALCRRHGLRAQATALEEQSQQLEQALPTEALRATERAAGGH